MYASPRAMPAAHEDYERWEPEGLLLDAEEREGSEWRGLVEKQKHQVIDYADTRRFLGEIHPERGQILEIGCGVGYLMDYFRRDGWEVTGVDPWREAALFAAEKLGIRTAASTLEQAQVPDAAIDAVIMLHVIEHLPDPVSTLSEIYRVLKPGGTLVMETPRYDSLIYRLLGKRERSLRCDGHVYFFETDTLRMTWERAGFEAHKVEYVGRTLSLERLAWNIEVMSGSATLKRLIDSFARNVGLGRIRIHINVRDMIRVYLKKPSP